jgi:hypothetical protein
MCQRVKCSGCGKPTFIGCGRHVEEVLGDVPRENRCKCHDDKKLEGRASGSLFERLFGR